MNFKIPEYKIGDKVWFIDSQENVTYAIVEMFTLAVSLKETNIYYNVKDDKEMYYVIRENDIIPHNREMKKPKFEPGDKIVYKYLGTDGKYHQSEDVVDRVESTMYDKHTCECVYIMKEDQDYWVMEDDILGYADPSIVSSLNEEM